METFGLLFFAVLLILLYVVVCLAWKKAIKLYGCQNTWMAWIPLLQQYALANAVFSKREKIRFIAWDMTPFIFKFWWIVLVINVLVPSESMEIAATITQILCLGTVFSYLYADAEGKTYDETKLMGWVSALIPIIAVVKIFSYGKDKQLESGTMDNSNQI